MAGWLAHADRRGPPRCPDADYAAEQFLGMLMGLDLVRSLYRVPRLFDASSTRLRIERVVGEFLRLYAT